MGHLTAAEMPRQFAGAGGAAPNGRLAEKLQEKNVLVATGREKQPVPNPSLRDGRSLAWYCQHAYSASPTAVETLGEGDPKLKVPRFLDAIRAALAA